MHGHCPQRSSDHEDLQECEATLDCGLRAKEAREAFRWADLLQVRRDRFGGETKANLTKPRQQAHGQNRQDEDAQGEKGCATGLREEVAHVYELEGVRSQSREHAQAVDDENAPGAHQGATTQGQTHECGSQHGGYEYLV